MRQASSVFGLTSPVERVHTDSMQPMCKRRGTHRHTLTYVQPGHPQRRRQTTGDRCNSLYFWCTVAWAMLTDREPLLDGQPVVWPEARQYLEAHAATHSGGLARRALKMVGN